MQIVKGPERRGRGRPPGRTKQGEETRQRLYRVAIERITRMGYASTTMRDVASAAGVSPGLLYRYFPSKRAVLLALYDELSAEYAEHATAMPSGRWRDRSLFALRASLAVLGPHREALSALVPVLVGDREEGIFAGRTSFSRLRVQRVFADAVRGSSDAPAPDLGEPLGRLLYLLHLAVLLWWLLDKSPRQRATSALVSLIEKAAPLAAVALRLPQVRSIVRTGDALFREALLHDSPAES